MSSIKYVSLQPSVQHHYTHFIDDLEIRMARRDLLNEDERRKLFGVPQDHDSLVKLYTLSPSDGEPVFARRGAANRLGFAVQLALLQHPGMSLATFGDAPPQLVAFMAKQIGVPKEKYADYAKRVQILSEHAHELISTLGLRLPGEDTVSLMIEAGARAAWSTDDGFLIASEIVAALRAAGTLLPATGRIERSGIAGRARARKQAHDALLSGASADQISKLEDLLVVDPKTGVTPLAWVREISTAQAKASSRSKWPTTDGRRDNLDFVP
jgi:hypothetical protein